MSQESPRWIVPKSTIRERESRRDLEDSITNSFPGSSRNVMVNPSFKYVGARAMQYSCPSTKGPFSVMDVERSTVTVFHFLEKSM